MTMTTMFLFLLHGTRELNLTLVREEERKQERNEAIVANYYHYCYKWCYFVSFF